MDAAVCMNCHGTPPPPLYLTAQANPNRTPLTAAAGENASARSSVCALRTSRHARGLGRSTAATITRAMPRRARCRCPRSALARAPWALFRRPLHVGDFARPAACDTTSLSPPPTPTSSFRCRKRYSARPFPERSESCSQGGASPPRQPCRPHHRASLTIAPPLPTSTSTFTTTQTATAPTPVPVLPPAPACVPVSLTKSAAAPADARRPHPPPRTSPPPALLPALAAVRQAPSCPGTP